MMKKKVVSVMLALVMTLGIVACGNESPQKESAESSSKETQSAQASSEQAPPKEEPKDPVTLEWYYRGNGIQKDTEAVNERVNELLKEVEGLEHVTLHMNPFIAADYANGVLLAQTSGAQIDILNTVGLNYANEVRNGTFLSIDDYLADAEYVELNEEIPEWLWEVVKIDGSNYIVPNLQRAASQFYLLIPQEYEQYVDIDNLRSLVQNSETKLQELADTLKQYVLDVREGTGMTKYAYPLTESARFDGGIGGQKDVLVTDAKVGFGYYADDNEVKNVYLNDYFKAAAEISAQWYQEGLWPQDMVVRGGQFDKKIIEDGGAAYSFINYYGNEEQASELLSKQYGYEINAIPLYENYYMQSGWGAGGNGITASCENPDEAMRFLKVLNTEEGKEIYNTIVYGLEGIHYEKTGENTIKTLEYDGSQGGADTTYAAMKWIIGNTFHVYLNQACSPDEVEISIAINNDPTNKVSPAAGFVLDKEPIATELEQCTAVVTEYQMSISWGVKGADWEAYYDEFQKKMESAGSQRIMDEIQAQFDEWSKTK